MAYSLKGPDSLECYCPLTNYHLSVGKQASVSQLRELTLESLGCTSRVQEGVPALAGTHQSPLPMMAHDSHAGDSNPSLPLQLKVPTLALAENSPSLPCLRRRKPSGAAFTTLTPLRSSPLEASHCSPNPSSWGFLRPHLLKKEHNCELVTTPKALP